jgi:hypothetical protein
VNLANFKILSIVSSVIIILNALSRLLKKLWDKIRFRFNYYVLSNSTGSVTFALVGSASGRNPYCRTYLGQRDSSKTHVVWYGGGTGIIRKLSRRHGLVVLSELRAPASLIGQVLHVPNLISLGIDLPSDLSEYLRGISASMRSNIRLLEKKNFTYQIITDASWTTQFYHHYYKPTMAQSHGDEAYTYTEAAIIEKFREPGSEFIKIFDGNLCIGAILCQHKGRRYHLINIGWLNGDAELKKKGVPSAFFWHSILRGFELGCNSVNFGGSPPYLENGVTRFKLPWGTTFCEELTVHGYRDLLLNPANPHCYHFLKENSIIAYGVDNCRIVLSSKMPESCHLRSEFVEGIEAWYLLRPEETNNWDLFSQEHLPLPLKGWYENIPLPHKTILAKPASVLSAL